MWNFYSMLGNLTIENSNMKNFSTYGVYLDSFSSLDFRNNIVVNKRGFNIRNTFFECHFCNKFYN